MISAGSMMSSVIDRWLVTGEETMVQYADKILKGINLCLSVPKNRGFLARSVSPFDNKSYYPNSSRDQYTHAVYALWYFLHNKIGNQEQNELCKKLLVDIASYAQKTVVEENYYTILNDNGKRGHVQIMWANPIPQDPVPGTQSYWPIEPHEVLRLPMIYAAAWNATGDDHWRNLMNQCMEVGIKHALKVPDYLDGYCLLQMQLSHKLLYEVETNLSIKNQLVNLMHITAKQAGKGLNKTQKHLDSLNGIYNYCCTNWRDSSFTYMDKKLCDGVLYMMPNASTIKRDTNLGIRGLGEKMFIQFIAPNFNTDEDLIKKFLSFCENFDYINHSMYGPIYHLMAYWALKAKNSSPKTI